MKSKSDFIGAIEDNKSAIKTLKNMMGVLILKEEKAEKNNDILLKNKLTNKIESLADAIRILEQRIEEDQSEVVELADKRIGFRLSKHELKTFERSINMLKNAMGENISKRQYLQITASIIIKMISEYTALNTDESFESFITNYKTENETENRSDETKQVLDLLVKKIGYLDKNIMKANYALYNDMYFSKHIDEWDKIYPAMEYFEPYFDKRSPLYEMDKAIESQLDKHYKYHQSKI